MIPKFYLNFRCGGKRRLKRLNLLQYLEDNDKLIQAILENLNAGRLQDGVL